MSRPKASVRGRRRVVDPSPYPRGWNRRRVQALIDYYEKQTDAQAIAEAEAAYASTTTTMIQVPVKLVPSVQRLLARAG
jgi:hypothetical protein